MRQRWCAASVVLIASMTASPGVAAEARNLAPRHLSPNATWVIHLNLKEGRTLSSSRIFLEHSTLLPNIGGAVDRLRDSLGLDPRTDVDALTISGRAFDPIGAVAVLESSRDSAFLHEQLRLTDDTRIDPETPMVDHHSVIHRRAVGDEEQYLAVIDLPVNDNRAVVLARDLALVRAMTQQMRRDGPDAECGSPRSILLRRLQPGCVLYAAAVEIDAIDPKRVFSQTLRRMETLHVELGEHDGQFFLDIDVDTTNDEEAQRLARLVSGVAGRLSHMTQGATGTGDVDVQAATTMSRESDLVRVRIRLPFEEFKRLMIAAGRRGAARRAGLMTDR